MNKSTNEFNRTNHKSISVKIEFRHNSKPSVTEATIVRTMIKSSLVDSIYSMFTVDCFPAVLWMLPNVLFGIRYTRWNWICVNYPHSITSILQIKMSTYELFVALIIGSSIMSRFQKRKKLCYFQHDPFKRNNNSILKILSFIVIIFERIFRLNVPTLHSINPICVHTSKNEIRHGVSVNIVPEKKIDFLSVCYFWCVFCIGLRTC